LGFQTEPLLRTPDHDGGRLHFIEGARWRRLDIALWR
jgi:hypothetical protein